MTLEVCEETFNKMYELALAVIKKTNQEGEYLRLSSSTLLSNNLARRIFIQHHEKMSPQLFIDLLAGPLPCQLTKALTNNHQKRSALKLLICLKRSSSLLGLERFFDFKFKALSDQLSQQ